jgi:fatty-acyl-CoA synthase
VATTTAQLDRSATRERVLEIVRGLLQELGSFGALPILHAGSHLDRELGLGSLERVELLARLETEFGVTLPDRAASEANTPEDLARAILEAPQGDAGSEKAFSALRASSSAQRLRNEASQAGPFAAQTLIDVLRFRATHDAERTHLLITEDTEGAARDLTLTFGQLYAAAQSVAAELARRGLPAGGRVAMMLPTSRAFFVCYAGILLAGAIPVPIYPPFRADRIEEYAARQAAILNNAEVCLLLTFSRAETVAHLLKPRVRSLAAVIDAEKLIDAADHALPPAPGALPAHLSGNRARKADDIALLQYTSGSTGDPKGVVLTHANLLANMRAIGEAVQLGPGDVGVSWLPLYHDMGLIGSWLTLLHYGIPVAVMSPLAFLTRPERWLWAFHKHRGTIAAAPNFAYELCVRKIADKDIEGLDLSSWRAALNGAEPVNPETLDRFAARFERCGFRREAQLPVYGLAEAALAVTVPPLNRGPLVDRVEREAFTTRGSAVPAKESPAGSVISFVSSGRPLPGHEVRIVDDKGEEVPDRTEGFLWFRGPSATSGYYKNPAATEKLFVNGRANGEDEFAWVNSGDRAYRGDGEIYVTGRVKDIIIKGGRNLYPHEVEELAARVDGLRKGCIVAFGLKDESSGTEKLVVVAEVREQDPRRHPAIAAAVTEQVSQGLGLPPDRVELLPLGSIPKTSSGKLRREETKQLFVDGQLSAGKAPAWMQIARLSAGSLIRSFGEIVARGFRRAVEILYGLYFGVVLLAWIVPTRAVVWLIMDQRRAARFTSAALRFLFALIHCPVRVVGKEHMDTPGAKIFAANHTSYFDVLPLIAGLGLQYRFVAKMEVHGMPFIGTFLRRTGHLTFNRTDPISRLRQAEEMEELLRRGESVFVFPEGTFTPEDGIRPFQLGAFKAAVAVGVPIIPVSLAGTRTFLRDGTYLPRPSSVTITVSPPIYPHRAPTAKDGNEASDWHELIRLRDETRAAIACKVPEPLL